MTTPSWQGAKRILAVRLDNMGDVVMTGPALRAVKETSPDVHLTLLASPAGAKTAPLLPWVDEVVPWRTLWQDLGRLEFSPQRELDFIDLLRCGRFDAAIVFTSFKQTPHPAAYACYLAGIPLRVGESKEWGGGVLSHAVTPLPDTAHQVERNLHLVEAVGFHAEDRQLGVSIPNGAEGNARSLLSEPYLLLNPWTSCPSRNYDLHRFADAALTLSTETGLPIAVTGVEKDRERSQPLFDALGERARDLMGKTDLPTLAALVQDAALILTNNTSVMHLADATRAPLVVLFAGTELPCQWQPRATRFRLLHRVTSCRPCYAFECPYNLECLDIPPHEVVAAGRALLAL